MDTNKQVSTGIKESPMRDILHKTTAILHGRGKVITLREHAEEKECITDVRKNFIYVASEVPNEEKQAMPQVHIKKSFDSVSHDEKFSFRVKGFFYVNHNRRLMKVGYCHTLRINLHWKVKASYSQEDRDHGLGTVRVTIFPYLEPCFKICGVLFLSVTQNSRYLPNIRRVWACRAGRALKITRMRGTISHSKAWPNFKQPAVAHFCFGQEGQGEDDGDAYRQRSPEQRSCWRYQAHYNKPPKRQIPGGQK